MRYVLDTSTDQRVEFMVSSRVGDEHRESLASVSWGLKSADRD